VPAAVAKAGLVSDEDLVRPEGWPLGQLGQWVSGWLRHPLPAAVLHEVADHHHQA
jgi:hypothetical protein